MFWDDRRAALFLLAAMLLTFAICMALHAGSLPERLPSGLFGGLGMALLVFNGLVWVMDSRGKRQSLQEIAVGVGLTALGADLLLQEGIILLVFAVLLAFAVPYALERWAPEQWRIAAPH